jgi:hypothetical protein
MSVISHREASYRRRESFSIKTNLYMIKLNNLNVKSNATERAGVPGNKGDALSTDGNLEADFSVTENREKKNRSEKWKFPHN